MNAWTEQRIAAALYRHFIFQSWWPLTQVTLDDPAVAGKPYVHGGRSRYRRIDMLMLRSPRKRGLGDVESLAIEIKVSRSDLLADVRDPAKQEAWREMSHRHAYAIPAGLARKEEIPAASGIITVDGTGGIDAVSWARKATYTTAPPHLPPQLIIALAARAAQAEASIKGLASNSNQDDDPEAMRAELQRLRQENRRLADRDHRQTGQLAAWRAACAAADGVPCGTCGHLVKPTRYSPHDGFGWRHVDRAHEAPCEQLRKTAAEEEARQQWEHWETNSRRSFYRQQAEHDARERGTEPWLIYLVVPKVAPAEELPVRL